MSDEIYLNKSQEQKDYYNQTASSYDRWHIDPASAKVVDLWNFDNLAKFLANKKITKALELGSGTGRLANNLFKIAKNVYGIDASEAVLKIAQEKYPQLKLTCGEVVNLPYQNNFFDLVIINGSLHHFFAVEKTFQEAYRVLKPGGAFVLLGEPSSQFLKAYNPFFYFWVLNRLVAKIFSLLFGQKFNNEIIEPDAESYKPWLLKKQLQKAGFYTHAFYTYDYFNRSNNKLWLKIYRSYLNFENKTIAKIFPYLGMAIQAFTIKKLTPHLLPGDKIIKDNN
ncbi:class I SAM-dependent methyltransferase [Patescibacteria group bacterium]|nr:class I SAM-dependent methyltransferase [Patescibacteria group bacterium]